MQDPELSPATSSPAGPSHIATATPRPASEVPGDEPSSPGPPDFEIASWQLYPDESMVFQVTGGGNQPGKVDPALLAGNAFAYYLVCEHEAEYVFAVTEDEDEYAEDHGGICNPDLGYVYIPPVLGREVTGIDYSWNEDPGQWSLAVVISEPTGLEFDTAHWMISQGSHGMVAVSGTGKGAGAFGKPFPVNDRTIISTLCDRDTVVDLRFVFDDGSPDLWSEIPCGRDVSTLEFALGPHVSERGYSLRDPVKQWMVVDSG